VQTITQRYSGAMGRERSTSGQTRMTVADFHKTRDGAAVSRSNLGTVWTSGGKPRDGAAVTNSLSSQSNSWSFTTDALSVVAARLKTCQGR
jgi:hypothetical protein